MSFITVFKPPPSVPGLIVTYSLNIFSLPISKYVNSFLYFKSWGAVPIELNGKNLFLVPIFVLPDILTNDNNSQSSPISTPSPIKQFGPILK